jgi:hypothetical protein
VGVLGSGGGVRVRVTIGRDFVVEADEVDVALTGKAGGRPKASGSGFASTPSKAAMRKKVARTTGLKEGAMMHALSCPRQR